ncbi:MAG: helix-turn-helix transcriptional regulator [Gemmatimonadota bacterium]
MTAEAQLARILHLIPLAARDGGATYEELAEAVDADPDTVVADLETVAGREFYHPAGSGDGIQLVLGADRVRAWTTGAFRRPVRLDLREAAALHLGLRLRAADRGDGAVPDRLRELEDRIAWAVPAELDGVLVADPGECDALRGALVDAARTRRRCEIDYLKPGAPGPELRTVDPYAVVYAAGRWYVIAGDEDRDAPRVFRVDRVLDVRRTDRRFTVPDDFDPADWLDLDHGRVFRADGDLDVTVRYSPRVARWIIERGEGEPQDDGSVLVTHTVADPGWIVRHVLQYGPDAEVVAPVEVRGWVREAVQENP